MGQGPSSLGLAQLPPFPLFSAADADRTQHGGESHGEVEENPAVLLAPRPCEGLLRPALRLLHPLSAFGAGFAATEPWPEVRLTRPSGLVTANRAVLAEALLARRRCKDIVAARHVARVLADGAANLIILNRALRTLICTAP